MVLRQCERSQVFLNENRFPACLDPSWVATGRCARTAAICRPIVKVCTILSIDDGTAYVAAVASSGFRAPGPDHIEFLADVVI